MLGSLLELVGLEKTYGAVAAVDKIDLKVPAGAYCCLLGPSGCGKSTPLRLIAGHDDPTSGDVMLDQRRVTHLASSARGTAMMFQSYALFPHMSILDNVAFPLRIRGVAAADRKQQALAQLEMVEMVEHAEKRPNQLSGGQQQRVALARALITGPGARLLDEPLSALDPALRVKVRVELKRIQRELGITFIHVTHSQEEAMALADLVVIMRDGRIEQMGNPVSVFASPATSFVARFLGSHNVIAQDGKLIGVRKDHLKLRPAGLGRLPARYISTEYQGLHFSIRMKGEDEEDLTVLMNEPPEEGMKPGDRVSLDWAQMDAYELAS